MVILEVKGLSFRYANQEEDTLKNINLKVEQGEWTAIVWP